MFNVYAWRQPWECFYYFCVFFASLLDGSFLLSYAILFWLDDVVGGEALFRKKKGGE